MKKHFNLFLFSVLFLTGFLSEAQRAQFDYVENAGRSQKIYVPNVSVSDYFLSASSTQVVTNKDIDGATASNSSRITLPKNTKSNLNGLTRKEATLVYASDEDKVYADNGSSLMALLFESGSKNFSFQAISTSQTASVDYDFYSVSAASGDVTLTLPTLSGNLGKVFYIKKTDSSVNKVIIDGNDSEQVEGGNDFRLFNQNDVVGIVNVSTSWLANASKIKKESFISHSGSSTWSSTANTWVTANITTSTEPTLYPISSNAVTIRKTAKYRIILRSDVSGTTADIIRLAYTVNGGSEIYINDHYTSVSAGGNTPVTESNEAVLSAGDVIRLRTYSASFGKTLLNGRIEIQEL